MRQNTSDTSGPAFPINANESADRCIYTGMTLRDYFAAKALQGILAGAHPICKGNDPPNAIAHVAYVHADAMLKERAK